LHATLALERWLARQPGIPRLVLSGYADDRAVFTMSPAGDGEAMAAVRRRWTSPALRTGRPSNHPPFYRWRLLRAGARR